VLPGVGSFDQAARELWQNGMAEAVLAGVHREVPLLGICLGMQLLFEGSDESMETGGRLGEPGLGVLPGRLRRFSRSQKTPHMGWNDVEPLRASRLLEGVPDPSYAYFVHSYYLPLEASTSEADWAAAYTEYGPQFASVVERGPIMGAQFHPEKSGRLGLRLLDNFGRIARSRGRRR